MSSKCSALLDERLHICTAEKDFYDFVGPRFYGSVREVVFDADKESFELAFEGDTNSAVIRMRNIEGVYKWVILQITDCSGRNEGNAKYLLEMYDIYGLRDEVGADKKKMTKLRGLLTVQQGKYFSYNPKNKEIVIFSYTEGQEVYIYDGNIDTVIDRIIKENGFEKQKDILLDLALIIKEGSTSFNREIRPSEAEKSEFYVIIGEPVHNYSGEYVMFNGVIKTFSENNSIELDYFRQEKRKDVLTGLLNKAAVTEYAHMLMARDSQRPVTIAIMDVDNFKDVNDFGGHSFGDEVLVEFAEIIKASVGNHGVAGRFGGDEFFIVLDGIGDDMGIRSVLSSIKTKFKLKYAYLDKLKMGCSIGSATYPKDAQTYDELFKTADYALYRAKKNGKGRYVIYDINLHGMVPKSSDEKIIYVEKNNTEADYLQVFNSAADRIIAEGSGGIKAVIDELGERLRIGRINVVFDDRLIASFGEKNRTRMPFPFKNESGYFEAFDNNGLFVMDVGAQKFIEEKFPLVGQFIMENDVYLYMSVRIGCEENVRGYITFEYLTERKKLKESEKTVFSSIGRLIAQTLITGK